MARRFFGRAAALGAFAIALAALSAAMPAAAQGLPPGSYAQSCGNLQLIDGMLIGDCRRINGTYRGTSLPHAWRCHGDIENRDGRLLCVEIQRPAAPGGTYLQTCGNVHIVDGELFADCRKLDGYVRPTRMPAPYSCPGDIANLDGHLRCVVVR